MKIFLCIILLLVNSIYSFGKIKEYDISRDTIIISAGNFDTLKLSQKEFDEIIKDYPEFISNNVQNPDVDYYSRKNLNQFNSEEGQDEYYILYAYFLGKKNGIELLDNQREILIQLYNNINSLFQHLNYGGTYFGHQYKRIPAYTEYALYMYKTDSSEYKKPYDINKQKNIFLSLLQQKIKDEVSVDVNAIPSKEKLAREKELLKYVNNLRNLIINHFYLEKAEYFMFSYY